MKRFMEKLIAFSSWYKSVILIIFVELAKMLLRAT